MMENLYQAYLKSKGVNTDTRSVNEGEIYFALKGPSFNGNLFAQMALDKGAMAVVIDEEVEVDSSAMVFQVEDVLSTLQDLARHHRKQLKFPFIGLTGSNGKTTAKELFRSVLSQKFKVHATHGNLNNHIGVPLTILSIPKDTEIAVVEMGANHQKEIELLSSISIPDIGYITNFGKAHLEGFGGVEGVIKGKSELYTQVRSTKSIALVNYNDHKQMEKSEGIDRITYGANQATYPMNFLDDNEPATVVYNNQRFESQLTGSFHTANIGAAISLGLHFGLNAEQIQTGISAYKPQNNRSEWREKGSNKIMLDAYNANPNSMEASILSFMKSTSAPRFLILGDMFELGDTSPEEHQKIVDLCTDLEANIILVGEHFNQTSDSNNFKRFTKTEECAANLREHPIKNASILLKGSRGMRLETLLEFL